MEENVQVQDEISLSEIFRILWRKVKLLAIVLAAGILGGVALGFVKNVGKTYYGTTISYYVNPYKAGSSSTIYGSYGESVANAAIELISEQKFAAEILDTMKQMGEDIPEKEINGKWNPDYKEALFEVQDAISVKFSDKTYSLLYVTVSVLNDEEKAAKILESVNNQLCFYLEEKMPVPEGYQGTRVEAQTVVDEVDVLNNGQMLKDMIKFGVLIGAATFIVGCVVVVIIERYKEMNGNKKAAENTEA